MKLLYCTSLEFPSTIANRLQILAMAKAFFRILNNNFYLGIAKKDYQQNEPYLGVFKTRKSFLLSLKYLAFIKKEQITHIYCREPRLLFFIFLYNKLFFHLPIKVVYEVHAIYDLGIIDFFIEKKIARWSDKVFFITFHLRDLYCKKFILPISKTEIFPDGVDMEIFDIKNSLEESRSVLNLSLDKKIIGYFGKFKTMGMDKGIDTILNSLALLPKDVIALFVGGKPKDVDFFRKKVAENNLAERATFIVHVEQKKLSLYQKACDVLLMPFPYNQHYAFYMSPLKMFEYMASKRPIVASDLPSIREVLNEESCFFCQPDNPTDLSRAIKHALSDTELSQKLALKAYDMVKNYTWDKRAERIIGMIT